MSEKEIIIKNRKNVCFNDFSFHKENIFTIFENSIGNKHKNKYNKILNFKGLKEIKIKYEKKSRNNILKCKYKIDNDNEYFSSFGETFISNNKKKCMMFLKNKQFKLEQEVNNKIINTGKKQYKIKLITLEKLNNIREMFVGCSSLISIDGLSDLNTERVIDIVIYFINALL